VVGDLDGGVYFRPETNGREIVVNSTDPECDVKDFVADPNDYGDRITDLYRERQCLRLMKRFPAVKLGFFCGVVALYDVTVRDWYSIADRTDLLGYTSASGRAAPPCDGAGAG
jgi:hypothetical protein